VEHQQQASTEVAPGWYRAPDNPLMLQWWDGERWIGSAVPLPSDGSAESSFPTPAADRSKRRLTRRTMRLTAIGVVTLIAITLISMIYLKTNTQINERIEASETLNAEIANIQSDITTEQKRLATFEIAGKYCNLQESSGFHVLDDGEAVELNLGGSGFGFIQTPAIKCFITEIGGPESVWARIESTRALDGRQEASWPGFSASWTYHPDPGLNMLIEHTH